MSRSYQTRKVSVDSSALGRLEAFAREVGIYDSKREATEDNYEEIIKFLMEYYNDNDIPDELRDGEQTTKYTVALESEPTEGDHE